MCCIAYERTIDGVVAWLQSQGVATVKRLAKVAPGSLRFPEEFPMGSRTVVTEAIDELKKFAEEAKKAAAGGEQPSGTAGKNHSICMTV